MARLTSALLERAARAARRHADISADISEAFEERYGATFSDVDADVLIDMLDYGLVAGAPTLAECDRIMAEAGHPARSSRPKQGEPS